MPRPAHIMLVVEDHPVLTFPRAFRQRLTGILERAGHQVTPVASASEGVRRACQTPPDLVVFDLNTPRSDGARVLRRLATDQATSRLPVLYLARKGQEVCEEHRSHRFHYLYKPFEEPALVREVARLLEALPEEEEDRSPPPLPTVSFDTTEDRPAVAGLAAEQPSLEALQAGGDPGSRENPVERLEAELRRRSAELQAAVDALREGLESLRKLSQRRHEEILASLKELSTRFQQQIQEQGESFRTHLRELLEELDGRGWDHLAEPFRKLEQWLQDEVGHLNSKMEGLAGETSRLRGELEEVAEQARRAAEMQRRLRSAARRVLSENEPESPSGEMARLQEGVEGLREEFQRVARGVERMSE